MDYKKRKNIIRELSHKNDKMKETQHAVINTTSNRFSGALLFFDFLNLKDGRLVVFEAE